MTQSATVFSMFIEEWARYQSHLAEALAPLTTEQLNLRAAPQLRSMGMIAAHIVAARAYWFHGVMGEGDTEFGALRKLDDKDAYDAGEIVRALGATWSVIRDCLARWTPAELAAETFPRRRRGQEYMLSRQWVIWHILEHDLHHGGELSLMLGMNGLSAPDV